ncbi:MAG TPA: ABC transporter ATP-binding protein [Bacillota bacterium]|nr:ABC transporter ATP-binding protein [Bacillota bacterium]
METKKHVLEIKDLSIIYDTEEGVVEAVNGVNLHLESRHTLGLVGETGAGKTTTALALLRLVPDPPGVIKGGEILINGTNILCNSEKEMERIRGKEIAMVFQDPMTALDPVFTVGEQIAESFLQHEKMSKAKADEKVSQLLEMVGIPASRAHEYPHQFSGGMKQRVVIAIALACNPKILIADEPTTALDVTIQAQVLALMKRLRDDNDTSMIMITHDLGVVAETCDEVAVMYAGRIVEYGTLRDVFKGVKHPYTEGLFNSLPDLKNRQQKLRPIPGLMPDPTDLPAGCTFSPRCPYATERCKKERPAPYRFSDTHVVECLRYDEPDFHIDRGTE